MRQGISCAILLFAIFTGAPSAKSAPAIGDTLPSNYVPSGKAMYKQYCASCHGIDGKGHGPYAFMLKVPPADLSTLAKRHEGKFPYDYVSAVLRFGPSSTILHGSADMPTWGPIFQYLDKNNERAVEQRIKNLLSYLVTLQEQ